MNEASSLTDITITSGVRETASEDGAVLLDAEQGICFSLNRVGLMIWELLKQHPNVEQVVDALEQQFHLPRAQLRSDVFEFVAELEARHLIFRGAQPQEKRSWIARILRNGHSAH
jgi:hypothetical protein